MNTTREEAQKVCKERAIELAKRFLQDMGYYAPEVRQNKLMDCLNEMYMRGWRDCWKVNICQPIKDGEIIG